MNVQDARAGSEALRLSIDYMLAKRAAAEAERAAHDAKRAFLEARKAERDTAFLWTASKPTAGRFEKLVAACAVEVMRSPREILGQGRERQLAYARFAIWLVLRETGLWSFPQIGARFKRDHTTVLSGVRKAEKLMDESPRFAVLVAKLREVAE